MCSPQLNREKYLCGLVIEITSISWACWLGKHIERSRGGAGKSSLTDRQEKKKGQQGEKPPLPGVTVWNCQEQRVGTGTTMYSLVPKFLSQVPATIRI